MEHDWQKYYACMVEIKHRTQICREALSPYWRTKAISIPNCELACLQLRKIYELIAFAALAAHKPRYQSERAKFEKDWRLSDIVKRIERLNPGFLPVAFKDVDGEITESQSDRFDVDNIIRWHSAFDPMLHALNPYKKPTDYVKKFEQCGEHLDRIVNILGRHKVDVIKDEVFYLVTMQSITDGSIQVATFYRTDGELIHSVR